MSQSKDSLNRCAEAFERYADERGLVIEGNDDGLSPTYSPNHGAWDAFQAGAEWHKSQPCEISVIDEDLIRRKMSQASYKVDAQSGLRANHDDFAKAAFEIVRPYLREPKREYRKRIPEDIHDIETLPMKKED